MNKTPEEIQKLVDGPLVQLFKRYVFQGTSLARKQTQLRDIIEFMQTETERLQAKRQQTKDQPQDESQLQSQDSVSPDVRVKRWKRLHFPSQ